MSELVATVLYAARQLGHQRQGEPSEMDVLDAIMQWKQRRRPPLGREEVAHTIRNLAALGWLNVTASDDLPLPKEELAEW